MTRSRLPAAGPFFLLLALALLAAAGARAEPPREGAPDLTGFRTVETAIPAASSLSSPARPGQAGYLGIHLTTDSRGRLVIDEVEPGSPAAQAGLQPGDQLSRAAGARAADTAALRELILSRRPDDPLPVEVLRKGKKLVLTARLGAVSRPRRLAARRGVIGIQVTEAGESGGARIRVVVPDSPASRSGVRVGDTLLKVDGVPLAGPDRLADSVAEREPGDRVTLTLLRDGKELDVRVELDADPNARGRGEESRLWSGPVYRLAVVRIEYPDVRGNPLITQQDWEEALFSAGSYAGRGSATGQPVHGSLNDYYLEQSSGALRVEGRVFDWVRVDKNRADYSQGTGTSNRGLLLSEALDALYARDGRAALEGFDGIFFLYAGDRVRTTRGGLYWPHRSTVLHRGRRWPYFIVPEGGAVMSNNSVICHEFGHMLGLPDLYARPESPGSEGLGAWCAMANQAGNGRPQHMSAWCKERLGWLKPAVVDPTVRQKLVLSPVSGSARECFKVLVRPDGSEYLLLENRRKTGFDQSIPAEGLLIWRVVNGRPVLEESHGVEGPSGPGVFLDSVPYPSSANNAYTPYTTPSSRSQLGGGLPVFITNVRSLPDGRISFYLGYDFQ